jgi:predicted PurR-regulated permease PerM
MTKHFIKSGAAIMTTLLLLVILWQFHAVIVFLLVSLMLAAALRPLVNHLLRKSMLVRLAWILLYLVVFIGLGFLLLKTSESAIGEIQQMAYTVSDQDEWVLPVWLEDRAIQQGLMARLPSPTQLFEAITGNQGQFVLPVIVDITQNIGAVVSGVVIIIILSIYWSINQNHFERLWLSLLPSDSRKQARSIWRTIEIETGAYLRAEVIQSLTAGFLLWLGFLLIGSPYPALLGMTGAIALLIPRVGITLVIVPVVLIGLLTSLTLSLFTALYALVILIALILWARPRLFNRKWDSPILTIVLLIALADALGFVGIIVAPPLSLIIQILWNRLVSHRSISWAAAQISDLKERQSRVKEFIEGMDEPPPALVSSSMERLTQLMMKAEPVLQASLADQPSEILSQIPLQPEQEA